MRECWEESADLFSDFFGSGISFHSAMAKQENGSEALKAADQMEWMRQIPKFGFGAV